MRKANIFYTQIHVLCCHKSHGNFGNWCCIPITRNQHSDTRKTQATHADLQHEPKRSLKYSAREQLVTALGSVVEATKRKNNGKKMEKQQKPLPLPSTLKAINATMIKIMITVITCHIHLEWQIMWNSKLLKVLAEKPQCKSSMREMFQLTQPSGYLQMTLFLVWSHRALPVHAVHTGYTHSLGHTWPLGLGELGSALRFICRDSYQSHQENRWQATLVSSTGETSKTWVLTEWRSWPLAALSEALGTLHRTGVLDLHGAQGSCPPAQGTAFLQATTGSTRTTHCVALKLQNL